MQILLSSLEVNFNNIQSPFIVFQVQSEFQKAYEKGIPKSKYALSLHSCFHNLILYHLCLHLNVIMFSGTGSQHMRILLV